jgi:hypothetical protein
MAIVGLTKEFKITSPSRLQIPIWTISALSNPVVSVSKIIQSFLIDNTSFAHLIA